MIVIIDLGCLFVADLVGAIKRSRTLRRVVGDQPGREFVRRSIDADGRGISQVLDAACQRRFEDIDRARHVDGRAQGWISAAEWHLQSRQMNDAGDAMLGEDGF